MNEIYAEAHGVFSARVRNVIAKLIFLLISLNGKRGNRRGELIVAKRLKPRGGQEISGKGKIESLADRGIADLGVMKAGRLQRQHAQSRRSILKLLAQQHAVIIRIRGRSRRR